MEGLRGRFSSIISQLDAFPRPEEHLTEQTQAGAVSKWRQLCLFYQKYASR